MRDAEAANEEDDADGDVVGEGDEEKEDVGGQVSVDHGGHGSYAVDQFRGENAADSTDDVADEEILSDL